MKFSEKIQKFIRSMWKGQGSIGQMRSFAVACLFGLSLFVGCGKFIPCDKCYTVEESEKIKVEVGQVWVSENDNPFKNENYYYVVIDIRDGWVKYKFNTGRPATDIIRSIESTSELWHISYKKRFIGWWGDAKKQLKFDK